LAGFGADQEEVATCNDHALEVAWGKLIGGPKIEFSHA
jgi:hypothetical protein